MKKDNINAICIIYLKYPFSESLTTLIKINCIWNFRLIQSSTKTNKAKVSIPSKVFKKILGENPQEGKVYPAPRGTTKTISRIEVKEIKIKNDKNQMPIQPKNRKEKRN